MGETKTPPTADPKDAGTPAPADATPPSDDGKTPSQLSSEKRQRLESLTAEKMKEADELTIVESAATEEPAPPAEKPSEPLPPQATTDDSKDADAIPPDVLKKAKKALSRIKIPDDMLEGLTDERIVEIGKQAQDRLKDRERLHQENQRLSKQVEKILAERDAARTDPSSSPATQTDDGAPVTTPSPPAEIDADIQTMITDGLKDVADDPILAPMQGPLTDILTKIAKRMAPQEVADNGNKTPALDQQEQLATEMRRMSDRNNLQSLALQPEMREQFPELLEPDTFNRVVDWATQIANADEHGDIYYDSDGEPKWTELLTDAASKVIRREPDDSDPTKKVQADLAKMQMSVLDGQPAPDSGTRTQPKSMSHRDALEYKAKLLDQGKTPEEIKKIAATLVVG